MVLLINLKQMYFGDKMYGKYKYTKESETKKIKLFIVITPLNVFFCIIMLRSAKI